MSWFEVLPENCPPEDASVPQGEVFYRLCESNPPACSDFHSHGSISPNRTFGGKPKCILGAVSVWEDIEKCRKITKLPRHRNKVIAEIELNEEDGEVKKTFGPKHYSWWRSNTFDPETALIVR